jgi:hypothetical protein
VNLAQLFAGIPYLVVGGIATRSYMPERATKDIDILVSSQYYDDAAARLRREGWQIVHSLSFPGSSLGLRGDLWKFGDAQIDLITTDKRWAEDAFSAPQIDSLGTRVIALPYLVLMKLDSARPQDTADITRMLAFADDPTLSKAREVVGRYARDSEAIEDFESLLEIGRWELERDQD